MFKEASHRDSEFEYFDDHIEDEDEGIKHSIKCLDFHMMISEEYLVCCSNSSDKRQMSMLSRASSIMMNKNSFKNTTASKMLSQYI